MELSEQIRGMRDAQVTVAEIARRLNLSVRRVYQILGPAKQKPRATDAQVAEIRRLHLSRYSLRRIATDMGMSRKTVAAIIGEDPAAKPVPLSDEEISQIQSRAAMGAAPARIAKDLGRRTESVRRVVDQVGAQGGLADWIQDAVIERVEALQLSAYRLAQMTDQAISDNHITEYLRRNKSMGSHKLQHLIRALGGRIEWD